MISTAFSGEPMNARLSHLLLEMAIPSVQCVWDKNENAYRTRYIGFPFESSLAYIERSRDACMIRAWIEVFDDMLDSELYEYNVSIPARLAGDGEEVAKRLLAVLREEWLDY